MCAHLQIHWEPVKFEIKSCQRLRRPMAKPDMKVVIRMVIRGCSDLML